MNRYLIGSVAAALTLGVFAGAQIASTASTPQESVFTPITPCRAMDTRPDFKIGPHATFGAGTVRVLDLWGDEGECEGLPSNSTAIAMNVTAVGGTSPSFLTLWPSDAASRPTASNLNWFGGEAPLPNKVDVALSSNGKVRIFNLAGTVDVIADVVGYYTPISSVEGTVGQITTVTAPITITMTSTPTDSGSNGQASATCPADQVAIGGGVDAPLSYPFNIRSSRPDPAGANDPTGWYGDVRSAQDDAGTLAQIPIVYALCIVP